MQRIMTLPAFGPHPQSIAHSNACHAPAGNRMDAPDMIDDRDVGTTSGVEWRVAHTLARCEKKVWDWLRQQGWRAELPLYRSVKRYRGKKVEFHKPLFPGYVFVQVPVNEGRKVEQHDQVARLLVPPDQAEFAAQLGAILAAIEAGLELVPVTTLKPGMKVEIISGPLRGLHGVVEKAKDFTEVILRLDFLAHAASVRIEPHEVEVV